MTSPSHRTGALLLTFGLLVAACGDDTATDADAIEADSEDPTVDETATDDSDDGTDDGTETIEAETADADEVPADASGSDLDLQAFLDRAAAHRITEVLEACAGKRVEAARRLGIDRTTLYRLMRRHGIG